MENDTMPRLQEDAPQRTLHDPLATTITRSKPRPPPVPQKPKRTLIQIHAVSSPISGCALSLTEDNNTRNNLRSRSSSSHPPHSPRQEEVRPLDENRALLAPPKEMGPSGLNLKSGDLEITLDPAAAGKVINEFGDCGQNLGKAGQKCAPFTIGLTTDLEAGVAMPTEAINQSETVPGSLPGPISSCPFHQFHWDNDNLSTFLALGHKFTEAEGSLDLTSLPEKVDATIQWLVQNVRGDGAKNFSSAFLEKLIRMLITSHDDGVKLCFREHHHAILHDLMESFCEEKSCSLVNRYYCLFYNLISHEIVSLVEIAKANMFSRIQQDFILASRNECRCGGRSLTSCSTSSGSGDHCDAPKLKSEHAAFTPTVRMGLASFLLIPLYTELACTPENSGILCPLVEKQFATILISLICDFESKHVFHDAPDIDQDVTLVNSKSILAHLLVSQNLCFGPEKNPILEAITHFKWDKSQLKMKLMTLFIQELHVYQKGDKGGIQAALRVDFQVPLGIQLMGVNGPLKLFSDILSLQDEDVVDVVFFNGHDLQHISTLVRAIQEIMGSDETTDEQLTLNIRRLRALVEQKLDQISIQERITFVSPSVLEVGVDFITQSMADINLTLANARYSELTTNSPTTTSTSSTKSATSRPEGVKMSILSRSKVMLWPLDRLLKWIGCSKRMASSTVSPASVRDVKYLEDTN